MGSMIEWKRLGSHQIRSDGFGLVILGADYFYRKRNVGDFHRVPRISMGNMFETDKT